MRSMVVNMIKSLGEGMVVRRTMEVMIVKYRPNGNLRKEDTITLQVPQTKAQTHITAQTKKTTSKRENKSKHSENF